LEGRLPIGLVRLGELGCEQFPYLSVDHFRIALWVHMVIVRLLQTELLSPHVGGAVAHLGSVLVFCGSLLVHYLAQKLNGGILLRKDRCHISEFVLQSCQHLFANLKLDGSRVVLDG